jgi:hypothetical protein
LVPSLVPTAWPSQLPTLVPSQLPSLPPSPLPTPKPTSPVTVARAQVVGLLAAFGLAVVAVVVLGRVNAVATCAVRARAAQRAKREVRWVA